MSLNKNYDLLNSDQCQFKTDVGQCGDSKIALLAIETR